MSDSQSREPGFESHFLPVRSLGIFVSPRRPGSLSCINEYLAIDGGGKWKCELIVFAHRCSVAECFPEKSSSCRNEQVSQGVKCTALCKNIFFMGCVTSLQVGVTQVGVRKKILDSIRQTHKKDWETGSLASVMYNKQIG